MTDHSIQARKQMKTFFKLVFTIERVTTDLT